MKTTLTLACSLVATLSALAQIPNPNFEDWTTVGTYDDPDGYISWNGLTEPYGVLVCTEGMPGHTGASHIVLTTQMAGVIVPAIATTGDPLTATEGFPYDQRPLQMTGWWQYTSGGGIDMGLVLVTFTKWNSLTQQSDDVGGGLAFTSGNVSSWTAFTVPISYFSLDYPDTATISLSASGSGIPAVGSTLRVDDLAFDLGTGIHATAPSSEATLVDGMFRLSGAQGARLRVLDALGRELRTATVTTDAFALDLSDAPAGVLVVEWVDATGICTVFRGVR